MHFRKLASHVCWTNIHEWSLSERGNGAIRYSVNELCTHFQLGTVSTICSPAETYTVLCCTHNAGADAGRIGFIALVWRSEFAKKAV